MAQCLQGVGDQRWRGSPPQTVPLPQGVLPVRGSMGNVGCRCTLKERFRCLDSSLIRNMDKVPTPPLFMLRLITCSDDIGKTDYRVAMRHARPGAPDHGDRGLIQRSPNDCVSGSPHIPGFCSLCRDKNGLNSCPQRQGSPALQNHKHVSSGLWGESRSSRRENGAGGTWCHCDRDVWVTPEAPSYRHRGRPSPQAGGRAPFLRRQRWARDFGARSHAHPGACGKFSVCKRTGSPF